MAEGLLVEFFQILCGVLLEFFDAESAAEFHLLPLINDALFVTHGTEVIVRDDAKLERVRFYDSG